MSETQANTQTNVSIGVQNLPLQCPMPSATRWNSHPHVYLALNTQGEALCPYCSTRYHLNAMNKQSDGLSPTDC